MSELHATIRHYGTLLVSAAVVIVLGFAILQHFAPPPSVVHGPVAVFSPSPVEREAQATINALQSIAAAKSGVSVVQQPAIAVIRDTGLVKGLSDSQVAEILAAFRAKTAEKVAVGTTVVGPSPAPTPTSAAMQLIYDAAYAADTHALADTTIKTSVDITRQEIPPSRVGSFLSAGGSGLSFGIYRHKQYELDLAGVQEDSHISPALSIQYLIPHTSLSVGPSIIYNHGTKAGVAAVVHF